MISSARRSVWSRAHRAVVIALASVLLLPTLAAPVSSATGPGRAGTVQLRTVPATPGVRLDVAGATVTTGPAGTADVAVADLNGIARRVTLAGSRLNADTTVRMTHVHPDPHLASHVSRLSIGLALTSTVSLRITSGASTVVPAQVSGIRLHAITGAVEAARPGQTVRLLARRAVLRHGSLRTQQVTWGVDHVTTTSPVAVTTAGPRFDPLGHPSWVVSLAPVTGTVTIRTVPELAGVTLGLGALTATTGPAGTATVPVSDLNVARAVPKVLVSDTASPARRVVRVTAATTTGPRVPRERHLLVALSVSRPVTFRFVDPRGRTIPADRVQRMQLSQNGRVITIRQPQLSAPVVLPSVAPRQVHGRWVARRLHYTVTAVWTDGANTVFAGRQRIDPAQRDPGRITLSVYALTVTVYDALLGQRISSRTVLTSASGARRSVRTTTPARIEALPRGLYQIHVARAAFGGHYPVLVSRNTDADLRVITRADLALLGVSLLVVAAAMVLTGKHLHRRRRPTHLEGRT
ncbi:MAG TPA: hypothetical protein VG502_17065 [Flexivirga sp.]|uniref:hypothetical protein n=1 Tax=Flexivirga sp. TaxID=1962927 RepID=UPI002CAB60EA|nr:hypothetical protein [Flexivirga sp.]HWC24009.1 hypothetical protein [Flexivirga sp.]